jgi:hypothetical protein
MVRGSVSDTIVQTLDLPCPADLAERLQLLPNSANIRVTVELMRRRKQRDWPALAPTACRTMDSAAAGLA